MSELQFDTGRLVIVGDTHGQLNDFCWILRSHGLPAPGNMCAPAHAKHSPPSAAP